MPLLRLSPSRPAQPDRGHHVLGYGVEKLRIADGSIMPRITTGNTMAPCVIIGERAAEFVTGEHRL
ncbi:MAG TPA: GMC oxidoreductase [Mycobacterium sp.]